MVRDGGSDRLSASRKALRLPHYDFIRIRIGLSTVAKKEASGLRAGDAAVLSLPLFAIYTLRYGHGTRRCAISG